MYFARPQALRANTGEITLSVRVLGKSQLEDLSGVAVDALQLVLNGIRV